MCKIEIAYEYTKTPGGRYKSEGQFSGEDFREELLKPKYLSAKKKDKKLEINLDGGYGYGSSFLEESFGGLVRELDNVDPKDFIIISDEEPQLIEDIKKYLNDAVIAKREKK